MARSAGKPEWSPPYSVTVECQVGDYTAYAYLCYDVDASSDIYPAIGRTIF